MKAHRTAVAAAAIGLVLMAQQPARSDDCDDVMERVEDAISTAGKMMEIDMAEITKDKPETDAQKLSLKNRFCAAIGESPTVCSESSPPRISL